MTTNKEVMARNIQRYMVQKGVNATELCQALGFKHNTFSDWVNAKTYPRIDAIEKMANYFGISKAFLVEDIKPLEVFSNTEIEFMTKYRDADATTREMIDRLLEYSKGVMEKPDDN